MNFKLLKIGLVCATIGLASCGGDSGATATTSGTTGDTTNPANVTVVANSGTVTVNTAPNNIVSIGASGTNFKTADATGKAVFTGLPAGAVDVHVFSADGYSATSYYGVNSSVLYDSIGSTSGSSVVDVYVQVANGNLGGTYYLSDGVTTYQANQNPTTGNVTFYVNWNVGSTINATIYGANGNATSSAGNIVFGPAEVVTLGTKSLTTTAFSGAALANLTATFANPVPTPATLATLTGITPATGTTAMYVGLSNSTNVIAVGAGGLTLPDTIASASIPGDSFINISGGDAAGTKQWFKQTTYTKGGSVSVAAAMNAFPTATAQTGATINWTASTDAHVVEGLTIYDTNQVHQWDIIAKNGVTSVTLPTPPAGVTTPLTAGTAYMMDVANYAFAATYEQLVAVPSLGWFDVEGVFSIGMSYTR